MQTYRPMWRMVLLALCVLGVLAGAAPGGRRADLRHA